MTKVSLALPVYDDVLATALPSHYVEVAGNCAFVCARRAFVQHTPCVCVLFDAYACVGAFVADVCVGVFVSTCCACTLGYADHTMNIIYRYE